jgi:hypothetical protein
MKTFALALAIVLLVAWMLGMAGAFEITARTNLLPVAAIALFVIGVTGERRSVV